MKKLMLGLLAAFAVTAEAKIVKDYGDIGNGLTATLDDQGVLTINGSGAMPNWNIISDQAWYNEHGQIKSVIAEGVTSIGRNAFCDCSSLTEISFPAATSVGANAFQACSNLISISLPNATTLEKNIFLSCSTLGSISLPKATSIGESAFAECPSLTLISLPVAESIGKYAFARNASEEQIFVTSEMKKKLEGDRDYYYIAENAKIICPPTLTQTQVESARYEVTEANLAVVVTPPSVKLKIGNAEVDESVYENDCWYYGVEQKSRPTPDTPTADDFKVVEKDAPVVPIGYVAVKPDQVIPEGYKAVPQSAQIVQEGEKVVSKDAQVVQEDEIAVKKESIAAPSAGTVTVENNTVQLGVTVLKTDDLTAEKKTWDKVKITKDNIDVDADGNIIVNVPVDSASGFMILQSKDAKIEAAE